MRYIITPNQRYGRLTVLAFEGKNRHRARTYRCRCDCGAETIAVANELGNGHTKSCGCLGRSSNMQHGHARANEGRPTRTYNSWSNMIQRCTNPKTPNYHHYGGRGIKVCERWRSFDNFLADMGERPDGMTLDRIDPNSDYGPGLCKWSTQREQIANRR